MHVLPPTSSLPPLVHLQSYEAPALQDALGNLWRLYWPNRSVTSKILSSGMTVPIRSQASLLHDLSVPDSGYASADESDGECECSMACKCEGDDNDDLDVLRADTFEREFAIRWLTAFVARSSTWLTEQEEQRQAVVDDASSLLASFVCSDEDETDLALTRSFLFDGESGESIAIELNDAPLDKEDHTSVGLQSWASSILLAKRMCMSPGSFSLQPSPNRILELGAGTGLLSIVTAKLCGDDKPTIVATDFHPEVLDNLCKNVATNAVPVQVCKLDWEFPAFASPLDDHFDVIFAADVIYHSEHARWIKGCAEKLLAQPYGVFWLVIPLRSVGRHEGMDGTVDEVFPSASSCSAGSPLKLAVVHREEAPRQGKGVGRADEGGYKLFKITWV